MQGETRIQCPTCHHPYRIAQLIPGLDERDKTYVWIIVIHREVFGIAYQYTNENVVYLPDEFPTLDEASFYCNTRDPIE